MTKEKFLTVRWNNVLTLGLGLPALIYVLYAFYLFGLVGEERLDRAVVDRGVVLTGSRRPYSHAVRLASGKLSKLCFSQPGGSPIRSRSSGKFITRPSGFFCCPFLRSSTTAQALSRFTVIIAIRLGLNLYTNNLLNLTPEQYESYPFRIP